jgi:hypothetical protein
VEVSILVRYDPSSLLPILILCRVEKIEDSKIHGEKISLKLEVRDETGHTKLLL